MQNSFAKRVVCVLKDLINRNVLFYMKISACTAILLLLTIQLLLAFPGNAQDITKTKITLELKDQSLSESLTRIGQLSGLKLAYPSDYVKKYDHIDLDRQSRSVSELLEIILNGTGLVFIQKGNTIVISFKGVQEQTKEEPAPDRVIKGKVTDVHGKPLSGVSIKIRGIATSTVSNAEGAFAIIVPDNNAVLLFSYIGYTTGVMTAGANTMINMVLKEVATNLEDIMVVGYGVVKKKDLTGSVGQVKMDDLAKAPVLSVDQALAGRIAGVQVSSNEGQPGAEGINIVIRGANSLTQGNSPLYVIDGFPIENPDIAALNPDDILSISVLKDASATAIYGARGANGVIVIETKKGKSGKTIVSYSGAYGLQQVTKKMKLMSPYEFVKYQNEKTPGGAASTYFTDGKTLESYKDVKGIDWQDEIFRTAPNQLHNIAVRGGNAQTKYSISGSLYDMQGPIVNSGQKRYQGRVSIDQTVNDKLKVGINTNYSSTGNYGQIASSGGSATSSYMYSVWGYRPVTGKADGDLLDEVIDDIEQIDRSGDSRINPVISAENELRRSRAVTLVANAYLSYDITKELTLRITGGINNTSRKNEAFYNSKTSRGTPLLPRNIRGVNGSVGYSDNNTWLNENTLNWKKRIRKEHEVDVLAGFSMQGAKSSSYGYSAQLVPNENLGMSGLDEGIPYASDASESKFTLVSVLSRINYSYKSKYLLTGTIRADGSSKFAAGSKWGYFPSGAFAWRMSSERFMKPLSFVSDAKLRISYGITGNNRVSDFGRLPSISLPVEYDYSFNNGTPSNGATVSNMGNPNLKWESTSQLDLGYDLSLFKNRIGVTVDVYRKTTYDLLLNASLPYMTGFSSVYKNIGKVQNQGLEISLNTLNIQTKSFTWETDFNISFNSNKILELTENQRNLLSTMGWQTEWNDVPLYIAAVGKPAARFYGYIWDGIYQYTDFDAQGNLKKDRSDNGLERNQIKAGDIRYKDLNDDGHIDAKDQTAIGRTLPVHTGGLSNNFSYKGFALNVFLQWSYGNQIYNANRIVFEGNTQNRNMLNQYASFEDRWQPDHPSTTQFRTGGRGPVGFYSSKQIEDGSYLRLKTVALSYRIPEKLIKQLKMSDLSLSISAQNLYTWTNYSGMDPEVSVRSTTLTPGFDYSAYPRARTLVFGLKASF
jgi:TonB-linked SusC/RagA family outer membrane protein